MGSTVNHTTINYQDQQYFNQFFATSFDKYDRNRDGKIDYNEFQPLINDMCQKIIQKYGNGPTVDKIRQAWYAMDTNRSGYITRQEFSTKAKREIERILSQPNYAPQPMNPHMAHPMQPHQVYPQHGPMNYGPHGYK